LTTNVYIDGFNFYYGALRNTAHRWLNLEKLCQLLLPTRTIVQIKYFTALVSARPTDPNQPVRQQLYLRALGIVQQVRGEIYVRAFFLRLDNPRVFLRLTSRHYERHHDFVRQEVTKMQRDFHMSRFDVAVVVSNDSDLLEPIKIVRQVLKKKVGILNPHPKASRALLPHIDFIKQIRPGVLKASQFAPTLTDAVGTFTKPATW
jgi:hypothetical protein